jgi:hypothetical protein
MSKITVDLDSEPGPHWLKEQRDKKGSREQLSDIRRKKQKDYQDKLKAGTPVRRAPRA